VRPRGPGLGGRARLPRRRARRGARAGRRAGPDAGHMRGGWGDGGLGRVRLARAGPPAARAGCRDFIFVLRARLPLPLRRVRPAPRRARTAGTRRGAAAADLADAARAMRRARPAGHWGQNSRSSHRDKNSAGASAQRQSLQRRGTRIGVSGGCPRLGLPATSQVTLWQWRPRYREN
jgi:hypothetical protein